MVWNGRTGQVVHAVPDAVEDRAVSCETVDEITQVQIGSVHGAVLSVPPEGVRLELRPKPLPVTILPRPAELTDGLVHLSASAMPVGDVLQELFEYFYDPGLPALQADPRPDPRAAPGHEGS